VILTGGCIAGEIRRVYGAVPFFGVNRRSEPTSQLIYVYLLMRWKETHMKRAMLVRLRHHSHQRHRQRVFSREKGPMILERSLGRWIQWSRRHQSNWARRRRCTSPNHQLDTTRLKEAYLTSTRDTVCRLIISRLPRLKIEERRRRRRREEKRREEKRGRHAPTCRP